MGKEKMEKSQLIGLANELGDFLISSNFNGIVQDTGRGFRLKPIEIKALIGDFILRKFNLTDTPDACSEEVRSRMRFIECSECGKKERLLFIDWEHELDEQCCWHGHAWKLKDSRIFCEACNREYLPPPSHESIERAKMTNDFRKMVYEQDEYQCVYCGQYPINDIIVEHMNPLSKGGHTLLENCVTACRSCNVKKSNLTPEEAGMELKYGRFTGS